MLPTQTQGAGSFAGFDLTRVPSPCFVVDAAAIQRNLEMLKGVSDASGVRILTALKAFSMWSLAPVINEYLQGACASGLWEAKLARAHYGGALATYAPAYKSSEIDDIAALSDHVVFNTPQQVARFGSVARGHGADIGLRLNPEHSEGTVAKYDPCAAGSRLGTPVSRIRAAGLPDGVNGLHMHSLCEQGFAPLARTFAAVEGALGPQLAGLDWLNLGGGHMVTRLDYDRAGLVALLQRLTQDYGVQTYLELGTSVAFDAGILVGEVLDVMENDGPLAILDVSATCHMPDVLEAPYRPGLLGEANDGFKVRLGGPTCLAGDVIGDYGFATPPLPGDRVAFLDQAHYSMVKTTTFNGAQLPAIALWDSETDDLKNDPPIRLSRF